MLDTQTSLALVETSLVNIGYDREAIVRGYEFTLGGDGKLGRADCVAFGDLHRHDLATSCIAIAWCSPDQDHTRILKELAFLAAPVSVLTTPQSAQVWAIQSHPTADERPLAIVPYDQLDGYFAKNRMDLAPESLMRAKHAGFQLSLFRPDEGLLEFAEEATRKTLVKQVEQAVSLGQSLSQDVAERDYVGKMVIMLLAACILHDKKYLGVMRSRGALDLLDEARRRYPSFFSQVPFDQIPEKLADPTIEVLRSHFTFRSVTNEMLGYLYENALVSKAARKSFRIYYTPNRLAREIVKRLPFEDIPPENRFVLDGTCGSGSLLLASCERLSRLLPARMSPEDKHSYLVDHIWGIDRDAFACELARLSLFLFSLPTGDSWCIKNEDFLTVPTSIFRYAPHIMVGNPPFHEARSEEGHRTQLAARMMLRYLDWLAPGGLIGVVLPETFLENSSCEEARKKLLSEFEVLETWQIPDKVIESSTSSTAVVLARKPSDVHGVRQFPVCIRRVMSRRRDVEAFLAQGKATYSYIVPSQVKWLKGEQAKMGSSPFQPLWEKLQKLSTGSKISVRNGLIPKPGKGLFLRDAPSSDWFPWLSGSSFLEPYLVKWEQQKTRHALYPKAFLRPHERYLDSFTKPKVLVNARRSRESPWRVYAALDDVGVLPRESIHAVWPAQAQVTLEEITAVLNNPLASAWVDSTNISRSIEVPTLDLMPFPDFSDRQREILVRNVRDISQLKRTLLATTPTRAIQLAEQVRILTTATDNLVFDAYGLTEKERQEVQGHFGGFRRPGQEWQGIEVETPPTKAPIAETRDETWRVTGEVLAVDGERGTLSVEFRGFAARQPIELSISAPMPGWLLRPGVLFKASMPRKDRESGVVHGDRLWDFEMVDFAYLSDQALSEHLRLRKQTLGND